MAIFNSYVSLPEGSSGKTPLKQAVSDGIPLANVQKDLENPSFPQEDDLQIGVVPWVCLWKKPQGMGPPKNRPPTKPRLFRVNGYDMVWFFGSNGLFPCTYKNSTSLDVGCRRWHLQEPTGQCAEFKSYPILVIDNHWLDLRINKWKECGDSSQIAAGFNRTLQTGLSSYACKSVDSFDTTTDRKPFGVLCSESCILVCIYVQSFATDVYGNFLLDPLHEENLL